MQFIYRDANGVEQIVRVDFGYGIRNGKDFSFAGRALANIHGKRVFTFCNVSTRPNTNAVLGSPEPEFTSIAGSYAVRSPEDQFVKATGRRAALGIATSQIGDRNLRKAIWDEYMRSHRDGKEILATKSQAPKTQDLTTTPVVARRVPRRTGLWNLLTGRTA